MATISQGILGGFSGKVGTVIGGFWKGIAYMRSIPASVTQPNTPAQLEHRAKFKAAVNFLQPLTDFLRIGFKSYAVKMSAFNAAMAYTMNNAITGIYPLIEIDYSKVLVCRGTLTGALNPEATSAVPGEIEFTWDNNTLLGTNSQAGDKAVLVVYNPTRQVAVSVIGGNTRASGSQTIVLPAVFVGDEVQCYISFQNAGQSVVSNSQFVSQLVV